ncbi:anthranilate synthase component I [Candidatus Sumerlaeota bacterium]|nr:anthranilate synthase component I [Candidatus Sumerlaeota bacterium]
MYKPDKKRFLELAQQGNLVSIYREMLADMETPVSAFKKIANEQFAFLLESVENEENIGRYSFLGTSPSIIFKSKGKEVNLIYTQANNEEVFTSDNPLDVLKEVMGRFQPAQGEYMPPFAGGAVGYIAYDVVRNFERIPDTNPDDLNLPDYFFMITDTLIVFDHVKHKMILVANAFVRDNPEQAYDEAVHKLEILYERLRRPVAEPDEEMVADKSSLETDSTVTSNFTREEFERAVRKTKEYIFAGDIFQCVLSQRWKKTIHCDPVDIYRALRIINPSPYMFYLKFGELKLIGSSPEILVKVTGNKVQLRPIAGTRPRGANPDEDEQLIKELLADPKERAEHIMLVDLGRNDLGRVCRFGTVRVDDLMVIEKYSHVMHIVSDVIGELRPDKDIYDVLAAAFPAGTVTGAPKIRAMEIIDELENVRRGPYAGAVGYFSFTGNLDSCITIRTIVVKGNEAYVQAGAGIVADSVPEREFAETENKARGPLKAIEMAEQGLE